MIAAAVVAGVAIGAKNGASEAVQAFFRRFLHQPARTQIGPPDENSGSNTEANVTTGQFGTIRVEHSSGVQFGNHNKQTNHHR
ncbi:hypothetical protein [Streptomyces sp. NPDC001260]|uniref:hypothetical protein n=1 Tax=Streptomyces sp. NPDC001260 TaxID=3364551 RepID=UPI003687FCB9